MVCLRCSKTCTAIKNHWSSNYGKATGNAGTVHQENRPREGQERETEMVRMWPGNGEFQVIHSFFFKFPEMNQVSVSLLIRKMPGDRLPVKMRSEV